MNKFPTWVRCAHEGCDGEAHLVIGTNWGECGKCGRRTEVRFCYGPDASYVYSLTPMADNEEENGILSSLLSNERRQELIDKIEKGATAHRARRHAIVMRWFNDGLIEEMVNYKEGEGKPTPSAQDKAVAELLGLAREDHGWAMAVTSEQLLKPAAEDAKNEKEQ